MKLSSESSFAIRSPASMIRSTSFLSDLSGCLMGSYFRTVLLKLMFYLRTGYEDCLYVSDKLSYCCIMQVDHC